MITNFKIFEYTIPNNWYAENEPKLYDYVILDINWYNNKINYFLNNTIGQISKIKKNHKNIDRIEYQILFENVPIELKPDSDTFIQNNRLSYIFRAQIMTFSNNKKDLESILAARKYNL